MTASDQYGPVWPAGVLYRDLTPVQRAAVHRRAVARLKQASVSMRESIDQAAASARGLAEVLAGPDETCASCGHRVADGCPCPHRCRTETQEAADLAAQDEQDGLT